MKILRAFSLRGHRSRSRFNRLLPANRSQLGADLLAGMTLAALGIPEVMGYTKIIGTPVVTGLYAMLLPMLAFALFGSSRHLVVSADSATAAMVAAALTALGYAPYSPRYVALTGMAALAVAGMLLLARLFRLGFLADFLSRTVLVGFLSGVGVQVAFGELHGLLGLDPGGQGFLGQLLHVVRAVPQTQVLNLAIALTVLAVIWLFEKTLPRLPGTLLAVMGMILASKLFDFGGQGIALVGTVPGGLPRIGPPEGGWNDYPRILPIAASCFVVILAQSAATARIYALKYRDTFDENTDLLGLALSNAAAGLSGSFVVNGSPTKTAMVDLAGGRTQVAHLTAVAMVLLVLLFLTEPLAALPNAVLAAIVFQIGLKLIDIRGLAAIHRKKPEEFRVALVTAATVVLLGVQEGILLALVLSLLQHVRRSYRPHIAVVMRDATDHWTLQPPVPGRMILPGMVMFWFGADLFYANAAFFDQETRRLVDQSPEPVRWLVIDASAITGLDYSAFQALRELKQDLRRKGVELAVTRIAEEAGMDWEQLELAGLIGKDRIFPSRHQCLRAYAAATGVEFAGGRNDLGEPDSRR